MIALLHGTRAATAGALLATVLTLATGCHDMQKSKHEKLLRQRYSELATLLCKGDYAGCVKYTNPEIVKAKGTEIVTAFYKLLGVVVNLAKLTPEDMRIDSIEFDQNFNTAELKTSYRFKNEWKPQKALKWVRVQGQWYLTDK